VSWLLVPFLLVCSTNWCPHSLKLDGMFSYSGTCHEHQRIMLWVDLILFHRHCADCSQTWMTTLYLKTEFDHLSFLSTVKQCYFFFKSSVQCFVNVVSSKTLMACVLPFFLKQATQGILASTTNVNSLFCWMFFAPLLHVDDGLKGLRHGVRILKSLA